MKHLKCERCESELFFEGSSVCPSCPSCGARVSSKTQALQGEAAVEALSKYLDELEECNPEELTEKQAQIIASLAEVLISTIDKETTVLDSVKQSQLIGKLRTLTTQIRKRIPSEMISSTK